MYIEEQVPVSMCSFEGAGVLFTEEVIKSDDK